MMAVELMPAIREALGLMPTDCTYVPRDVTRRITTMMAMQTAAITVGVGSTHVLPRPNHLNSSSRI